MAQSDTKTRIKPLEAIKEPPLYRVVYLNDNQTTYEFVIESLIEYFDYTAETAEQIKYYDGALRRRQLRLILGGKMKPDDATELKALFVKD